MPLHRPTFLELYLGHVPLEKLRWIEVLHGQILVPDDEIRTDSREPSADGTFYSSNISINKIYQYLYYMQRVIPVNL